MLTNVNIFIACRENEIRKSSKILQKLCENKLGKIIIDSEIMV
jgi:hypothetical protein